MGPDSPTTSPTNGTDFLLDSFVRGERGGKLRTQLSTRFPECSAEQIEEAVQYACKAFLDEAEDVSAPGKVYAWIRTAAFRYLNREADRHRRELAVDPVQDEIATFAADEPGPAEELIALEDDADLTMLVDEVSSSLSDRRRDVLALYGAGYKRPQIADRLGLSERTVKRELLAIMDQARTILARLAGGGCLRGEPMVVRFVCGVSTPDESAQAREHLSHCERCELFSERLIAWREKAGAMLPAPVAEGVSPGVLERLAQKSADGFSSLKQHVLDSGAQIKQHAATTYYRTVDPTPLAAARPGTVASVIASCIAIGDLRELAGCRWARLACAGVPGVGVDCPVDCWARGPRGLEGGSDHRGFRDEHAGSVRSPQTFERWCGSFPRAHRLGWQAAKGEGARMAQTNPERSQFMIGLPYRDGSIMARVGDNTWTGD